MNPSVSNHEALQCVEIFQQQLKHYLEFKSNKYELFCLLYVFRNGAQLQEDRNPQPGLSLRLQLCHAVPQVRTTGSFQSCCVLSHVCVCADCAVVHSNCSVSCCRYAFSKNNQPTMLPIPNANVPFGNAKEMSRNDIARLKTLYKCCECPHEHIMNIYTHTLCVYIDL